MLLSSFSASLCKSPGGLRAAPREQYHILQRNINEVKLNSAKKETHFIQTFCHCVLILTSNLYYLEFFSMGHKYSRYIATVCMTKTSEKSHMIRTSYFKCSEVIRQLCVRNRHKFKFSICVPQKKKTKQKNKNM